MKRFSSILLFNLLIIISLSAQDNISKGVFTQFFYGDGKVSSEGMMIDNKPDGTWTAYYSNGQIKSIGKRTNFLLDSVWKFFNEEGVLVEEISYLNGKKSGFTIRYQSLLKNDSVVQAIRSKELFLNDKKEGQGFYYSDNGQIDKIIRYKGGKKHGLTRIFGADSLIQALYKYHNDFMIDREFINQRNTQGQKQGLWKTLYDNDNIRLEENYKDGLLHGYYREYSERGELLVTRLYENGQLIQRDEPDDVEIDFRNEFNDQGEIIASGAFKNDKPVGTHRKYTEDRSVIETTEYSDNGEILNVGITDEKGLKNEYWKFYYSDGNIKSEGNFLENLRNGVWKYYYPDGKLEQTGSFRNGVEDGKWIWYYPDGSVRREENYYRGREDGLSEEFDNQGNLISKGEYLDGLEEGEWYYHVGDHTEKGFYKGGEKDGLWIYTYLNGITKFSGEFLQGYASGKHRYYYEDGKIMEERFYELGRKERTWRKYDTLGNIILTLSYSNDNLIKINGVKVNVEDANRQN